MLTFNELSQSSNKRVLLVDALNLAFRYMHKRNLDFIDDYKATIESIARSYKCGRIILASDKGSSKYRLNLLPTYKANRKEKRKDQTEEDKQFFSDFFAYFELMLSQQETVFRQDGIEADDIAAYIVKNRENFGISHIWLLSSDKDWDLLVDENVSRFSYVTRKETTVNNWSDHYEVPREKFLDYKCLLGDSSDNVSGIKGVGPKRAAAFLERFHTMENIYNAVPIPGKAQYIKNLNENRDLLPLNEKLFNILSYCDEILGDYTGVVNDKLGKR